MGYMCYDKVTLWMGRSFTPNNIETIADRLDNGTIKEDIKNKTVVMSGYKNGLKVSFYPSGVSIIGSLPKFLYNDNIHPLTRASTAEAINAISEALGFDVSGAKVNTLEFGFNFPMSRPVQNYLSKLGSLSGMQMYKFSATSTYYKPRGRRQQKTLCFYDKIADAKAKGMAVPVGLVEAHLLRYELRLNGRLSHQLGIDNITASTLSDRSFYKQMLGLYQYNYKAIDKQKQSDKNNMENIKSVSDACELLLGRLLNEGEQGKVERYLDELKRCGVFDNRNYYTRLKNKLIEASNKASSGLEDELVRELNNDIENLGAYI